MSNQKLHRGIQAVYKPIGISSYDVIRKIKKDFPGEKIGHGGTLDPLAEGVLVIGIGKDATRQLGTVLKGTHKTYETVIELGKVSETDDSEGPISTSPTVDEQEGREEPSREEVEAILEEFLGEITQTPPRYSAIKIDGVPAYKRARRGEAFQMPEKKVSVKSLEILSYDYPFLALRTQVGSGTYIRALARDIGDKLGCGGYMKALKRTAVGEFTISEAVEV